jgi:hypothetical protein
MKKKKFKIEVFFSAIQGILLCPIDDVYKILQHAFGESVWTHEIPAYCKAFAKHFPEYKKLADYIQKYANEKNWQQYIELLDIIYPFPIEIHQFTNERIRELFKEKI